MAEFMKIGTTRAETFSDGVLAIIITIMVLELKLPDLEVEESKWGLRRQLLHTLHYLVPYTFSFMMIGIFWINHHHMFHLVKHIDERLLVQNLIFLFWVSLIPFCTAVIAANPQLPEAIALYALLMLFTSSTFAWMRSYTIRKKLVHTDRDRDLTREVRRISVRAKTKSLVGAGAYVLALPLAFVNIYLAYACFAVLPILFFIPDGIDNEKLAEKVDEKNH